MKFDLDIKKVKYVKILYKDSENFSHYLKTAVKSITSYDVYTFAKKDEWIKIPAPQDVKLNFACEDGLYTADSVLKYTTYEEPYLYLALKLPQSMEYRQKREFFRVRMNAQASIIFNSGDEIKKIHTKIYNISASGISILLDKEIKFPEEVLIDIEFLNRTVHVKSKYIRTDSDDDILYTSFNFMNLSVSDMDYISQMCIRKQLEDKRNSLE